MKEVGKNVSDRAVVQAARDYAEAKRIERQDEYIVGMAIEMPDGSIVTGRNSELMVAAAAAVLNATKRLARFDDELLMITPNVLETTQKLKTDTFGYEKSTLSCEEILMALAISGANNPSAAVAVGKLPLLRNCRAHCTAILSDRDEQVLSALGLDVTCDPEYMSNNLYTQ